MPRRKLHGRARVPDGPGAEDEPSDEEEGGGMADEEEEPDAPGLGGDGGDDGDWEDVDEDDEEEDEDGDAAMGGVVEEARGGQAMTPRASRQKSTRKKQASAQEVRCCCLSPHTAHSLHVH